MSGYDGPAYRENGSGRPKKFNRLSSDYQPAIEKRKAPTKKHGLPKSNGSSSDLSQSRATPPSDYEVPFLKDKKKEAFKEEKVKDEQSSEEDNPFSQELEQGERSDYQPALPKSNMKEYAIEEEPQPVPEENREKEFTYKHSLRTLSKRMVKYKEDFILFDS